MSEDKKIEKKKELTDDELMKISGGLAGKGHNTCPHCHKNISFGVHTCPNCGGSV